VSLCFTTDWPFCPQNCPFPWGSWSLSFGLSKPTTQTASQSIQPFLHSSLQNISILYNGPPFPLKIASFRAGSGLPSNIWFLEPTRAVNQMASQLIQLFLQGSQLHRSTERPTDRATRSVTVGHTYVCSTAIWPNNVCSSVMLSRNALENCSYPPIPRYISKTLCTYLVLNTSIRKKCMICWIMSFWWPFHLVHPFEIWKNMLIFL